MGFIVMLARAPLSDVPDLFYALGSADLIMFGAFVAAGVLLRLMLLATVAIIDAGVGRWPLIETLGPIEPGNVLRWFVIYSLTDLPILGAIAWDGLTMRIVHPAFLWGGLALVVSQVVRVAIIETKW